MPEDSAAGRYDVGAAADLLERTIVEPRTRLPETGDPVLAERLRDDFVANVALLTRGLLGDPVPPSAVKRARLRLDAIYRVVQADRASEPAVPFVGGANASVRRFSRGFSVRLDTVRKTIAEASRAERNGIPEPVAQEIREVAEAFVPVQRLVEASKARRRRTD